MKSLVSPTSASPSSVTVTPWLVAVRISSVDADRRRGHEHPKAESLEVLTVPVAEAAAVLEARFPPGASRW